MIRFACPQCGKGLQVEDKAGGKRTKCPKCTAAITIPLTEAIQTSTPAPPPANPSEDDLWNTIVGPSSRGSTSVRNRKTPLRGRARNQGPSLAVLGIGGILLVGVAVGVTLWATGTLPKAENSAARVPSANAKEQQGDKAKVNLAIFDPAHRAVTELRAAQEVGMKREKFQELLQQFSTEVIIATEKAQSPTEKKIADGYRQVLEIYKDSAKIWDVKVSIPSLERNADKWVDIAIVSGTDCLVKNLAFHNALADGIPLDTYPSGGTGLDDIVNRYSISVEKKGEYRIISESSIQLLWQKAGEKMEEVNKLRRN